MMGKTRLPYSREYREEAVQLVRESGKSIGQIAKDPEKSRRLLRQGDRTNAVAAFAFARLETWPPFVKNSR